jgi:hypothetical protein
MPNSSSWWLTNWPYVGFTTAAIIRAHFAMYAAASVNSWKPFGSATGISNKELLVYRQSPAPDRAGQLREKFDELSSTLRPEVHRLKRRRD